MLSDMPRLEKSRDEIAKRAEDYAKRVGFNIDGFDEVIVPVQLQAPAYTTELKFKHTHLEMRRLIEQKEVDIPIWEALWTKDVPIQNSKNPKKKKAEIPSAFPFPCLCKPTAKIIT